MKKQVTITIASLTIGACFALLSPVYAGSNNANIDQYEKRSNANVVKLKDRGHNNTINIKQIDYTDNPTKKTYKTFWGKKKTKIVKDTSRNLSDVYISGSSKNNILNITQHKTGKYNNDLYIDLKNGTSSNKVYLYQKGQGSKLDIDGSGVDDAELRATQIGDKHKADINLYKSDNNNINVAQYDGNGNYIDLDLKNSSDRNTLQVSQLGSNHKVDIHMDKSNDNNITVAQFRGDRNELDLDLHESDRNDIIVAQYDGRNNFVDLDLKHGSDKNKVDIYQCGSNNHADVKLTRNDVGLAIWKKRSGSSDNTVLIHQNGNGHKANLTLNNVDNSTFTVNQNGSNQRYNASFHNQSGLNINAVSYTAH